MSRWDDEADRWLRDKAAELGWLDADPHPPGEGRGLWAFYAEMGVLPPERAGRIIPRREVSLGEPDDTD